MATRKSLCVKLARTCLVAAVAAGAAFAADAADANGISCKVTGVAVVDETQGDRAEIKYLPPDTRVVVPSARHFALFRVEYDVPMLNVKLWKCCQCCQYQCSIPIGNWQH